MVKMQFTRAVKWVECTGEAHERGNMSDHCMVCLPFWGTYPTCPVCGSKVHRSHGRRYAYYCPKCRIFLN